MDTPTQTADRILNCAHALIMERGYNGFSYADIAQTVGITKASIHHHFATKAVLGKEVVAQYRAVVRDNVRFLAEAGANPTQKIQAYIGHWVTCIQDRTTPFCICALLAAELTSLPQEVVDEVRGHFIDLSGWLTAVLNEGAAQGRFVLHRPADQEAASLMAVVHGGMLAARALDNPAVFETITSTTLSRLIR